MNSHPIHIPLTYTGGDCRMTWKSKHATEPPCPRIKPRPHPVRRQKRQPNDGKSVSPPPKPNFFYQGALARGNTSLQRPATEQRIIIFARAAVEDQSRITLTTPINFHDLQRENLDNSRWPTLITSTTVETSSWESRLRSRSFSDAHCNRL